MESEGEALLNSGGEAPFQSALKSGEVPPVVISAETPAKIGNASSTNFGGASAKLDVKIVKVQPAVVPAAEPVHSPLKKTKPVVLPTTNPHVTRSKTLEARTKALAGTPGTPQIGGIRKPPAGVDLPSEEVKDRVAQVEMDILIDKGVILAKPKQETIGFPVTYLNEIYEYKREAWTARSCAGGNLLPKEDCWSGNTAQWTPALLLVKASVDDLDVETFDFQRAYLNADMDKTVFIRLNPSQTKRAIKKRPE